MRIPGVVILLAVLCCGTPAWAVISSGCMEGGVLSVPADVLAAMEASVSAIGLTKYDCAKVSIAQCAAIAGCDQECQDEGVLFRELACVADGLCHDTGALPISYKEVHDALWAIQANVTFNNSTYPGLLDAYNADMQVFTANNCSAANPPIPPCPASSPTPPVAPQMQPVTCAGVAPGLSPVGMALCDALVSPDPVTLSSLGTLTGGDTDEAAAAVTIGLGYLDGYSVCRQAVKTYVGTNWDPGRYKMLWGCKIMFGGVNSAALITDLAYWMLSRNGMSTCEPIVDADIKAFCGDSTAVSPVP